MSYILTIAAVDRTAIAHDIELGGQAWLGESTQGSVVLDDDAGTLSIAARKAVVYTEDATTPDTVLARGFVTSKGLSRGTRPHGAGLQRRVAVDDVNKHLRGIRVHGWVRPSETDVARVTALRTAFLAGSPRTVTNLAATYLAAGNTVTMPAKTYDATDPHGVLSDCASAAGKTFFVTVDLELFYDLPTSVAYAGTLVITDVTPDLVTQFAPIWEGDAKTEDGSELLSGGALIYADGKIVTESRAAVETAHEKWEETVYDDRAVAADAVARLTKLLDERDAEEPRYAVAVYLPEAKVNLVKWGQTISFRAAAAGQTSAITVRVARLMWKPAEPGFYFARMELERPRRLSPRLADTGQPQVLAAQLVLGDAAVENKQTITFGAIVTITYDRERPGTGWPSAAKVGSALVDNVSWTQTPCAVGAGAWRYAAEGAVYWTSVGNLPADASYLGLKVLALGPLEINGAPQDWLLAAKTGAVPAELDAGFLVAIGGGTGQRDRLIPRSLIAWGAALHVVALPSWRIARGQYLCDLGGFSALNDGLGGSGAFFN